MNFPFASIAKQCAATTPQSMGRAEMLSLLNEIVSYNETSLSARPTFASSLEATVTASEPSSRAGPKFSQPSASDDFGGPSGGPLIRRVDTHKLPLSLWGAVLPWEVQRGYSCTPAAVVNGKRGLPLSKRDLHSDADEAAAAKATAQSDEELLRDDPLAFITPTTSKSMPQQHRSTMPSQDELHNSNGVLFIHRGNEQPHYWSGGIQAALDVSFFSLPSDETARSAVELAKMGVKGARSGHQPGNYQLLSSSRGAGYGIADDPGPYHHYLTKNKLMALRMEASKYLDPFPAVLNAAEEGAAPFGGDHHRGLATFSMDKMHQCSAGRLEAPVTAILETRRRLVRDFLVSINASGNDGVGFNLVLSEDFMRHLEEKEMFYRDLVEGLEMRVTALLNESLMPLKPSDEKTAEEHRTNATKARPMESWREEGNVDAPKDELLSQVPSVPAESRLGTGGSFSVSKMKAALRVAKTQPGMAPMPPVDVELFVAATRLGLSHTTQQRVTPRIINELIRGRVDTDSVALLHGMATDPSIQLYPPELLTAIHKAHATHSLKN